MQEKILVVDDNVEIREIIQVLLSSEGYMIIEADSAKKAIELLQDDIDLIILDVMMPEMDGFQACRFMRTKTNAPILFLTAKGQESDKTLGFSSGGDDYLTKPFSYNELNARVKALLRRYRIYQGKNVSSTKPLQMMTIDDLVLDEKKRIVTVHQKDVSLTDIEYDILHYLLVNRHQIISSCQLYEAIWQEDYYYGANNTIMVHIRHLRQKIEDNPREPKIIKTSWGKGYYCD